MIKLIIIVLTIIGTLLFFGTYEEFNLLYCEENKVDNYTLFGLIPIAAYCSVDLFIYKYRHPFEDNRLWDAIKYAIKGVLVVGLFYYLLLVPVLSGAITLSNNLIGRDETILVKGEIIHIVGAHMHKSWERELTVKTDSTIYTFDTDIVEVNKYKVGDRFEMKMQRGFWGLLWKK